MSEQKTIALYGRKTTGEFVRIGEGFAAVLRIYRGAGHWHVVDPLRSYQTLFIHGAGGDR